MSLAYPALMPPCLRPRLQALAHVVLHSGMEAAFVHCDGLPQFKKALLVATAQAGESQKQLFHHPGGAAGGEGGGGGGVEAAGSAGLEGASGSAEPKTAGRAPKAPPQLPEPPAGELALRLLVVWGGRPAGGEAAALESEHEDGVSMRMGQTRLAVTVYSLRHGKI